MALRVAFSSIILILLVSSSAFAREWTDTAGRTIEAKFVRFFNGKAILQRGSKVQPVPIGNLCEADREYIKEELRKSGQPSLADAVDQAVETQSRQVAMQPGAGPTGAMPPGVASGPAGIPGPTGTITPRGVRLPGLGPSAMPSMGSTAPRLPSPTSAPRLPTMTPPVHHTASISPPTMPSMSMPSPTMTAPTMPSPMMSPPSYTPPSYTPPSPSTYAPPMPSTYTPPMHGMPGQQMTVEVWQCSNCMKTVSAELKAGDRCPHCKVTFDYVEGSDGVKRDRYGNRYRWGIRGGGIGIAFLLIGWVVRFIKDR